MPYTLSISPLLDDGGFYSAALPSLTGRIFSPPPPSGSTATPLDTATSSNLTLSFTSAGVPPAGSSAMILTEPAIGGDFPALWPRQRAPTLASSRDRDYSPDRRNVERRYCGRGNRILGRGHSNSSSNSNRVRSS